MQPEAGLGWAGEGGCRSYLWRIHPIWPSSGGVAGTFPPQVPRHGWHTRFCACRSDLGRPSQTGRMGRRRETRGDERRRRASTPTSLLTKHPRAIFCLPIGHLMGMSSGQANPSPSNVTVIGDELSTRAPPSSEEAPDRHVASGQSRDRPGGCDRDCRSLRPIGTPVVRYIRTWLDVVLDATTCRRSGPTQEALSRFEQSRRSRVYTGCTWADPCRLGWAWCSGGVTAFVCPPLSSNPPRRLHSLSSTIPFHSTHSLIARPPARALTPSPSGPGVVRCVMPSIARSHARTHSHTRSHTNTARLSARI